MRVAAGLVVVSLAAGLAAGYALFHPGPAVAPSRAAPGRRPVVVRRPAGAAVETTPDRVVVEAGEVLAPRSLDELRDALRRARSAGNWTAYRDALLELAAVGTPEGDAMLVAIMGDTTLRLAGSEVGPGFFRWLKDSDVAGILEAARARALLEIAERPDARSRGLGWLSLVALHGGAAELAWIESLGHGRSWEVEVDRALADAAGNPLAARRLADRILDPDHFLWRQNLDAFAAADPRAAFDAALEALGGPRTQQREELLRLVGAAVTEETAPDARRLIESLEGETNRLEAVAVIDRMRERGLSTSGYDEIIDLPRRIIAEYATGGASWDSPEHASRLRSALNVVRSNPVTWDAATLALVQRVAERVDGELGKFAHRAADRLEAGLAEGGAGWAPER